MENKTQFDIKEFKELFAMSDLLGLEYLHDFISIDLQELYFEVLSYNEIFGNGWTIKDLLDFGKKDEYWKERAKKFIEKHNVKRQDYDNYVKFFDEYTIKRDLLLEKLNISV